MGGGVRGVGLWILNRGHGKVPKAGRALSFSDCHDLPKSVNC